MDFFNRKKQANCPFIGQNNPYKGFWKNFHLAIYPENLRELHVLP